MKVLLEFSWGYIRVLLGSYWDNGNEYGNYYTMD